VLVSTCNRCDYCQIHHTEAVKHYWKDETKVQLLKEDYRQAGLTERELSLCAYAEVLTLHPGTSNETDHTRPLKEAGFDDSAILDATLVIAYFNFVNRMVSGLDVDLEEDEGTGYKY